MSPLALYTCSCILRGDSLGFWLPEWIANNRNPCSSQMQRAVFMEALAPRLQNPHRVDVGSVLFCLPISHSWQYL